MILFSESSPASTHIQHWPLLSLILELRPIGLTVFII
jgi:hypothetical protein